MRSPNGSPYITFHGPDGVGKTTTARKVVEVLNEKGHPAVFFDDWRDQQGWKNPFSDPQLKKEVAGSPRGFVALQAAKLAVDSEAITELTESGLTVVKDRGVFDVRADLSHRGLDRAGTISPLVREPDMAVCLTATEETRQRRLVTKVDIQPEDFQPNVPGTRLYDMTRFVLGQVEGLGPERGLIVPTDDMDLEQVVNHVASNILEEL